MTDQATTPAADASTYFDHSELRAAMSAPEYATSARYRDEVAAKLSRSTAAGTIDPSGQRVSPVEGSAFHTRTIKRTEPETMYGVGVSMPGADPLWAEAAKVSSGFFDGPEAIARAMSAPQYDLDAGYRQAVADKIGRSIREKWINAGDFSATDPSQRFTRP